MISDVLFVFFEICSGFPGPTFAKMFAQSIKKLNKNIRIIFGGQGLTTQGIESKITWAEDFKKLGYSLNYGLYNAADYGVPQTRERVFFIGTKNQNYEPLNQRHYQDLFQNPSLKLYW